ncbi:MAG: FAD-dependent oxidoreductase [Actinomycetota bacterium]
MPSSAKRERIAVVGSGVSGLVAAYLLDPHHDVTLFEANTYVGGHVDTHEVHLDDQTVHVDTGFIVYNDRNYPYFSALLEELNVTTQESEMTFSVVDRPSGNEYAGTNLNALFATRSNMLRPKFWRMLIDILRFNRAAKKLLAQEDLSLSVAEFLKEKRFGKPFITNYLIPMGSSIWSANPQTFDAFPAGPLAQFFHNHGLLSLGNRPQWRTVTGGSATYVRAITSRLKNPVRCDTVITTITRTATGVELQSPTFSAPQVFDRVLLATHADTALAMLVDASELEKEILGCFPFQDNLVQLHTDTSLLPTRELARASWNYLSYGDDATAATLTYYANKLQQIESSADLCVTLNAKEHVDPKKVLAEMRYTHPVYDEKAFRAQKRHSEIDGLSRTHFLGAYWGFGFHEDGAASAYRVANKLISKETPLD